MKKVLCMVIALVLCLSMAVPAYAADTFVPSITYKDGPDIKSAVMDGGNVISCLVVTSIAEAKNKSTDITQDERDLLLELYTKLNSGEMKLPISNDQYVIRELVDVSFTQKVCVDAHTHEDWLSKAGNTVTVDFDLGVKSSAKVIVMVYADGQWSAAEKVTNKGNGVVTVAFEQLGAVAFCVDAASQITVPQTGDTNASQIMLWGGILVASVAAMVIVFILFKRSKDEEQ